jgi:dolichol kinase
LGVDKETLSYSGEAARKALHLLAMIIPAGMLVMDRIPALALLIPCAVAAVATDLLRWRIEGLGRWLDRVLGFMMRDSERGESRSTLFNGATWVMVTGALLLLVFPARFAAPAMITAMLGDAAAALVGRPWGRHPWPGSNRTVEGTAAFVVVGMLSFFLFPAIPVGHRAAATVTAAAAELVPLRINDNLLMPFAASTVLWLLAGAPALW